MTTPSTPCAFPRGKKLYFAAVDGRKVVVETWAVTQHRKHSRPLRRALFVRALHSGASVDPLYESGYTAAAVLVCVDPPPASWKGKVIASRIRRDHVPLNARVQDTDYAASIPAAANKALLRLDRRRERLDGYLNEATDEDERAEYRDELRDMQYAKTALKKLIG